MQKTVLITIDIFGGMSVYEDGTYRCKDWEPGDYSEWKIDNGDFYFKHGYSDEFCISEQFTIAKQIKEAIDKTFEVNILEAPLDQPAESATSKVVK